MGLLSHEILHNHWISITSLKLHFRNLVILCDPASKLCSDFCSGGNFWLDVKSKCISIKKICSYVSARKITLLCTNMLLEAKEIATNNAGCYPITTVRPLLLNQVATQFTYSILLFHIVFQSQPWHL